MPKARLILFAACLLVAPVRGVAQSGPVYDVVIRGGVILDGSGLERFRGDVAFQGGYIVAVGDLGGASGRKEVDATNLFVAPGFINIHSHAQADAVSTAVNMLTQGVTTEIINADGLARGAIGLDIRRQLDSFAGNGLAVNLGAYIGFNTVWRETVGQQDVRPTAQQTETMRGLIESNLRNGAWGVSSGLDYRPAYYAHADEVVQIVSAAKPWRTNFPNHDRMRPEDGLSSQLAVEETITIAERAGMAPVVTHIKSQGKEQGQASRIIDLIERANARGVPTFADVYPYTAGQTSLAAFLVPGWAADGGRDALLRRMADPALRPKIAAFAEDAITQRFADPDSIYIIDLDKRLPEVMAAEGAGAGETVLRVLERIDANAIITFGTEADVRDFIKYPGAAISCDCGASLNRNGHPRQYGTFPRILGRYVRNEGLLAWEEAIRKSTALPANIIGMVDRGYIAPGMRADVVLFDPATIGDRATYAAPALLSEGVRHVFVNGGQVLEDGAATGRRDGEILLRSYAMPTRPMTGDTARSLDGRGRSGGYDIRFTIDQGRGEKRALGTLSLVERSTRTKWMLQAFGTLQTAPGWASVTGTLRDVKGAVRPFTMTVDRLDAAGGTPVITIALAGSENLEFKPLGKIRLRR